MAPHVFTLDLPDEFSLEETVWALRRTKTNIVDVWQDGQYIRALQTSSGPCLLATRQKQPTAAEVAVFGLKITESLRGELTTTLRRMLGLDVDVSAWRGRFDAAPGLREIARQSSRLRPPRFPSLFETIASVVPFQQLSLAAGVSVLDQLAQQFGKRLSGGGHTAWIFPAAEVIAGAPLENLRGTGMSASKCATLRSAACAIVEGDVREEVLDKLPTPEVLKVLDDLPGIGPWSAGLIALRGLGRLDVFPPGDTGVRRALGTVLGYDAPISPEEEHRLLRRLRPAQGLLYFYTLAWRLRRQGVFSEQL